MIKVQIENLRGDLQNLSAAMTDFEPYSTGFISNTRDQLDNFNSDFISEISDTLKNMTDTKAPKLLENMQDFYTSLSTLLDDFEKTDETIAESKKRE